MYNIIEEFKLDEKVEYFVYYYLEFTKLYDKELSNLNVFNLHSLCKNIIEEITKNNVNRNLKFFQTKLREVAKKDYFAKQNFKYKVNEIINNMTSNKEYALLVVNNLMEDIKDGQYGEQIINRIIKLLFSSKTLVDVKEELKYLTKALIIEYIIYGYSLKSIEKIMHDIFSKYNIYENYFMTKFPIPKDITDDQKKKEYIDKLSIKERIEKLSLFFKQEKNKYYYLFNIKGIVGDFLDIKLNNVNIYNWKTKHKFDMEISNEKSPMYEHGKFEENNIHCCILVELVDKNTIFDKIKQELDNALDILYNYHNIECKIEIDYSRYIVFDENKQVSGEGMTKEFDENFKREVRPLDYNYRNDTDKLDEQYKKYSEYILKNDNETSKIIKSSVRYFRKSKETNRLEDKILNYWICIENLFNIAIDLPESIFDKKESDRKFNKIYSILPYIIVKNNLINVYWNAYDYFNRRYNYEKSDLIKELSNESKEKLQFDKKSINLINFINNYELLDGISQLEIDKDKYKYYYNLLNDKNKIEKHIEMDLNKTKETILLLYRFRNMIVHNAQYDITFSNIYEKQFEILVLKLLGVVIDEYYKSKGKNNLENIIINRYINQKQIVIDVKEHGLKEWFNSQLKN